jgi:hypothetical protein
MGRGPALNCRPPYAAWSPLSLIYTERLQEGALLIFRASDAGPVLSASASEPSRARSLSRCQVAGSDQSTYRNDKGHLCYSPISRKTTRG